MFLNSISACSHAGLLPRASDDVLRLIRGFTSKLALATDTAPERLHPVLAGTIVLPSARLIIAGTRVAHGLERESAELADLVDHDLVLLRKDISGHHSFAVYASTCQSGRREWYEPHTWVSASRQSGGYFQPADPATSPAWLLHGGPLEAVPCPPQAAPLLPYPVLN